MRALLQRVTEASVSLEGEVFSLCDKIRIQSDFEPAMKGRSLYCLFYEPSFLTRTSFEQAAGLMDGQAFHTEDASQFFPVHAPNYIDNIINILDIVSTVNCILSDNCNECSDMNGDDVIDILDIVLMVNDIIDN